MKEKQTKHWTNNLGTKLLSLPLAFLIWIIIINIDDPTISRNYPNVAIQLQNVDAIASLGKVYEIAEGNAVTVTVTGKRSVLDKIRSSDLEVTADLKQMSAFNRIDVEVKCEKYAYADLSFSTKPKMLTVSLEDKKTRQFKVNIVTTGSVDDNFYVGSMEAKPKMVEVTGAESVIDKIADIRVTVPLSEETESFKHTKLVPKAYDADGKEIDSSKLEFSNTSITIEVNVQETKVVPIEVTTTGTPAAGYGVLQTDYDPSQIKIAGAKEVLAGINSIPVVLDISGARATIEKEIVLTDYLPEGVTIVGTTNSIAVKATVEQMVYKEFTFTVNDVNVTNVPEGLYASYVDTNRVYKVTVMGMEDDLETLSMNNLGAYVDLDGLSEGMHMLPIKFQIQGDFVVPSSPSMELQLSSEVVDTEPDDETDQSPSEENEENNENNDSTNLGEEITPDNEE